MIIAKLPSNLHAGRWAHTLESPIKIRHVAKCHVGVKISDWRLQIRPIHHLHVYAYVFAETHLNLVKSFYCFTFSLSLSLHSHFPFFLFPRFLLEKKNKVSSLSRCRNTSTFFPFFPIIPFHQPFSLTPSTTHKNNLKQHKNTTTPHFQQTCMISTAC